MKKYVITLKLVHVALGFLLPGVVFIWYLISAQFAFRVAPVVYFNGQDIGGKNVLSVEDELLASWQEYSHQTITIASLGKMVQVPVESLSPSFDISELKKIGKIGFFLNPITMIFGTNFIPKVSINNQPLVSNFETSGSHWSIREGVVTPPQLTFRIGNQSIKFLENNLALFKLNSFVPLIIIDKSNLDEKLVAPTIEKIKAVSDKKTYHLSIKKMLLVNRSFTLNEAPFNIESNAVLPFDQIVTESHSIILSEKKLSQFAQKLNRDIYQEPVNARLVLSGNRASVFSLPRNGKRIDRVVAIDALKTAFVNGEKYVRIPVVSIKPDVSTTDDLERRGISQVVGEGVSHYWGSANRIHNIAVGTSKFSGILIKPGAVFSFNQILGPVDGSTGFVKELVILQNKTTPQFGGGLCQVATTFFRAAFFAGLPILERYNHAYRVSYYDWPYGPGFDATIYPPHPDVLVKNDTKNYLLIQTKMENGTLSFIFYGTKPNRKVVREGPFVTAYLGAGALNTVLYRKIYENKKLVKTDTFYSQFDSPAKYPHTN